MAGRRDAEALAKARPANDPAAAAVLARLAIARGAFDEALRILEGPAAVDPRSDAALELGLLQQRLGHQEQGNRLLTAISNSGGARSDGESLLRAGRAAQALKRAQDANSLYRAAAAAGADPAIDTAWGTLFLETYNAPEALRSFNDALKADAEWAPAHVGVARTLADENPPAAAAAAAKALEIDPKLAEAHLMLAQFDLDNARFDAARERIDQVLEANDADLDARSLLAGIAYVRSGRAAFDAEARRVLAINPALR